MSEPRFDPKEMHEEARRLLNRASWLMAKQASIFGLTAFMVGLVVAVVFHEGAWLPMLMGALGALIGFLDGQEKARALRLQAQEWLWRVEIIELLRGGSHESK